MAVDIAVGRKTEKNGPREMAAPVGREQEQKPHSSMTGAGETSVAHDSIGSDPDCCVDESEKVDLIDHL